MTQRQFFGPCWINKNIHFEKGFEETSPARKTWKIVREIYEKNDQGPQVDWEDFDHTPMIALALFECANSADDSERALMKIYIQFVVTSCWMRFLMKFRIPYIESEGFSPEEKLEQASPEEEMNEEIGLRTLTNLGCKSAPQLINYKREIQG
jgi:hypothetical protein